MEKPLKTHQEALYVERAPRGKRCIECLFSVDHAGGYRSCQMVMNIDTKGQGGCGLFMKDVPLISGKDLLDRWNNES